MVESKQSSQSPWLPWESGINIDLASIVGKRSSSPTSNESGGRWFDFFLDLFPFPFITTFGDDFNNTRCYWQSLVVNRQISNGLPNFQLNQGLSCSQLFPGLPNFRSSETQEFSNCGDLLENCEDDCKNMLHDGLLFALKYLDVKDLLLVEMVCRGLRDAVRNDIFLWQCIHLDYPLSLNITDNRLLQLAKRAKGNLICLKIQQCRRVTDEGLRRVLEINPRLQKLNISGSKVSVEGLIDSLKKFKSVGHCTLTHLRLGRFKDITHEQFEELKVLLGLDKILQKKAKKPLFFPTLWFYSDCNDDRVFDHEICPICQLVRPVYDCPSETCHGNTTAHKCRACFLCIARCNCCGKCLRDENGGGYMNGYYDYRLEKFFGAYFCLGCWKLGNDEKAHVMRKGKGSRIDTIFLAV